MKANGLLILCAMNTIDFEQVENKIITLRNTPVILDSDVAELYGVETKRINEAVTRNPGKFPQEYIIGVTKAEWDGLKSQFATSIKGGKTKLPLAFTERGLYMLATILKSEQATRTTLAIIDAFYKLRLLTRQLTALPGADEPTRKSILQKSSKLIEDLLTDDLPAVTTETTIELNLAVLKIKHSVTKSIRPDETNQ
ncbi:MAG: ORF6N domain-containing protein [Odoribacter laneus]|uniref:ORF6N domain-containing protein n=1 Tax=Odoribacter laneus TaxID=626933 RepID=UPI00399B8339